MVTSEQVEKFVDAQWAHRPSGGSDAVKRAYLAGLFTAVLNGDLSPDAARAMVSEAQ